MDEAREVQESIYALNVRAHKLDTLDLIPSLMRRAEWQHRVGFINDERTTYRRIIRIIESKHGRDDLALVDPLVMLGRSFFFIDTSGQSSFHQQSLSTGEIYFKRALRIATENPESEWTLVTDATLALGDFYMFDGNPQRARQVYRDAWTLLSEPEDDAEKLERRRLELEGMITLKKRPLPRYIGESNPANTPVPSEDPVLQGRVTVTYGISARGRVADLKLVEAEPPEFTDMQNTVQREIRRRVFRPTFADAEPVATSDHVFIHTYYYRQSDLDAARQAAAAALDAEES